MKYLLINIFGTLLRGFPMPCKTGLITIGNPGRDAPVFLTCNFILTVERVKRALKGLDCWLLVANSKGINVWCASTGGHLTNHSVISVLKTSGIEKLVDHRDIIVPQLSAAGIEATVIRKNTGWKILWGPVYAKYIPEYLERNHKKTSGMREVRFPVSQRIEMALMWTFPFTVIVAILTFFFWPKMLIPLVTLTFLLPLLIFISFPLYEKILGSRKTEKFSKYTVIFDFSRVPFLLWIIFLIFITVYSSISGNFSWGSIVRWGFASLVIILLVSIDLMGSTPVYKSGLHEDRLLKVILDEEKCTGCTVCVQVCPRNCYSMDTSRHIVTIPRANQCVQCGACIVACQFDALYFRSPDGKTISPDTIRRFKLNLMGKRFETKIAG
ncbi:MAG: copper oxidase [Chlorobi bacterium]|nr:copper oxidase [Chlorobiota bacterium]